MSGLHIFAYSRIGMITVRGNTTVADTKSTANIKPGMKIAGIIIDTTRDIRAKFFNTTVTGRRLVKKESSNCAIV